MPTLTRNQNGVLYSFNPLTKQWAAQIEGHKAMISQNYSTLVEKVEKKVAPPVIKAVASETLLSGLAGVPLHSAFYSDSLPSMVVTGLTGKLGWKDTGAELVRYQENEKAPWSSVNRTLTFIDPRGLDSDDEAYWKNVITLQLADQLLNRAEQTLATAWAKQAPDQSQSIYFSVRLAMGASMHNKEREAEPIEWKTDVKIPAYERKNYAALSSAWPVLIGPSALVIQPEELDAWKNGIEGVFEHVSGVKIQLVNVSQYSSVFAVFAVTRPGPQDTEETVYESEDFLKVFRLAQITAQVVEAAHPQVGQWKGFSDWLKDTTSAPEWPTLVFTQAAALICSSENPKSIVPFVLQADATKPLLWKEAGTSAVYMEQSPIDSLRGPLVNMRAWRTEVENQFLPKIADQDSLIKKMSQAALDQAYNDAVEGEPATQAQATARVQLFFDRSVRAVEVSPVIKDLEAKIAKIMAPATDVSLKSNERSRRSPR